MILLLPPALATLDLRATSLSQALPELSKAYGVPMRAAPAIGGEIVILSLKAAPLPELKERLAQTFAAEWRTEADGTLVLNRSTRLRAAEERAFFERRRTVAAELLAGIRKRAKEAPAITGELLARYRRNSEDGRAGGPQTEQDGPEPMLPERRLLSALLAGLTPNDLTHLSDRIVFSNLPTTVQRPLPVSVEPLLVRFENERHLLASLEIGEASDEPPPPTGPIRTLQLTVETEPDALSIELDGYDAAGRLVANDSEETSLLAPDETTVAARESVAVAIAVEPVPSEPKRNAYVFPASPETKAFVAAFGKGTLYTSPQELNTERSAVPPFLDVVARDPLSFALSDVAFEAGRLTNRSVIVRPGDEGIFAGTVVGSGAPHTIEEALNVPKVDLGSPGWLLARPTFPYSSSLAFFDRPGLRDALAAAYADGRLSLDTAMKIATVAPDRGIEPPLIVLPNRMGFGRNYLNLRSLRIFAALGPDGLRRAASGVRVGDLSSEARERLRRLVFGPVATLIRTNDPRPGYVALPFAQDLEAEPTSLLPNGLPPDALVTVTTVAADGVVPVEASLGSGRPTSVEVLATYAFQVKNPRLFPPNTVQQASRWSIARLRQAGREITTLRLDLTTRHHVSLAHQAFGAPSGPEFTMANLPSDLRAAFDAAMSGVEARYKNAEPYVSEGDETPPPRW